MVTQRYTRLHEPQQNLNESLRNGYTRVTQAAEAEPSSASTAPQNFRRIVKELRLYKTLACMSGRNMRKKYKKPAKFDKKRKVLENLNKNF